MGYVVGEILETTDGEKHTIVTGETLEMEDGSIWHVAPNGKALRDLNSESKGMWELEDLEERITKTMFAMYDNRWHPRLHPKRLQLHVVPTKKELDWVRDQGVYFAPKDSLYSGMGYLDVKRYGLPDKGSFFHLLEKDELEENRSSNRKNFRNASGREGLSAFEDSKSEYYLPGLYLKGNVVSLCKSIGNGWIRRGSGLIYRKIDMYAGDTGVVWLKSYITVDQNTGKAVSAIESRDKFTNIDPVIKEDYNNNSFTTVCSLMNEGEKEYRWNVTAIEGVAKASFGVYEEQIKSLFYARTLPMTETGRKRPILHWVASHRRRLKEGIDVDVKKHMRGVIEFTMLDTSFKITNPPKNEEEREAKKARKTAALLRSRVPVESSYSPPETIKEEVVNNNAWMKIKTFIRELFH